MKKYFMKESGKELNFGDSIVLEYTEVNKNGGVEHHFFSSMFLPELIEDLLELGIIREEEVEDEEEEKDAEPLTDEELDRILVSLMDENDEQKEAIEELRKEIKTLKKEIQEIKSSEKK